MKDQVLKRRQCSEIVWAEREVPSVRMRGILASLLEVSRNCRQFFSPIHEPENESTDFGLDARQLRVLNALPADLLGICNLAQT